MELEVLVKQINDQLKTDRELTEEELYQHARLAMNMFRNVYNEAPEFDLDAYGRIILLEKE